MFGFITVGLPILGFLLLSGIDHGWLDRPIERWASHRLKRTVRFRALETHLTSSDRSITIRGLTISGPNWAAGTNVAQIDLLSARVELLPLLRGDVRIPSLSINGPHLHLIRRRDGSNNWTFPGTLPDKPPFAMLAATRTFLVARGQFIFDDQTTDLLFTGAFSHQSDTRLPLILRGHGLLRGGGVDLSVRGGALNGASVGRPYPFVAHLDDGGLHLDARGTSGQPFDLRRYDLAIAAHGPNLSDFAYLFNLQTPNSAPFALSTHARANDGLVNFTDIAGRTGETDFTGWIRSDQSSPRHKVASAIWSKRWAKRDVDAWMSPLPPRGLARSTSGRLAVAPKSRWLLSDEAFPASQLRGIDFVSAVHISALEGYALPLQSLRTLVTLDHGKLTISGLKANLYGGRVSGAGLLDVRRSIPNLFVRGSVRNADLSKIHLPAAVPHAGTLSAEINMRGAGRSVHAAAGTAAGVVSVRVTSGTIPQPAAFLLGGDLLRGIGTLPKKNEPVHLDCARATLRGVRGQMLFERFAVQTPEGVAGGQGILDLRTETINVKLAGQPTRRRLFQVAMPVLMQGPLSHPRVEVLPGRSAAKLGLKGRLGVVLSPLAALLPLGPVAETRVRCY
jgi:uncharacterized protein involved in outer membrane biogenesis